jgi:hypothetical protein
MPSCAPPKRRAWTNRVWRSALGPGNCLGTIDLNSLHALSTAVGLDLRLVPQDQALSTLPLRCEDQPAPSRSPLADPRWGLAWSNRGASDETLVHNALLNGNFELLLQAALAHGLDAVHQQWRTVAPSLPARARSEIDRKLRNIAQGFADAQA